LKSIFEKNNLKTGRSPLSAAAIYILIAFCIGLMLTAGDYLDKSKIIIFDVACYYNYLPAAFKYQSFDFVNLPMRHGFAVSPEGIVCEKTSMGLAFLYMPFYLIAVLYTKMAGLPNDEYSSPFMLALNVSAIFYLALGLIFLRKILLLFFSDKVTALGISIVFLGSNLLFYSAYDGPMSHVYVFSLISIFIWLLISWQKRQRWNTSLLLGLITGLLTLIRPSTALIFVFVLFFFFYNRQSSVQSFKLLMKNIKQVGLAFIVIILVWVPQMLYWKYATGSWLYFSYAGEKFFFNNPLIHLGFFSYRNGWLMYSPVMIFSIIGMFFLRGMLKQFRLAIIIYFLISIYVIFSWWCWWWVGLGIRAMIELYPVLAIALCAFLDWMFKRRRIFQITVSVFVAFFFLFGLFKNWQFKRSMIHYDGMTSKTYWSILFKTELPQGYWDMLQCPDYDEAKKGNR
jgi:hypothetical protein